MRSNLYDKNQPHYKVSSLVTGQSYCNPLNIILISIFPSLFFLFVWQEQFRCIFNIPTLRIHGEILLSPQIFNLLGRVWYQFQNNYSSYIMTDISTSHHFLLACKINFVDLFFWSSLIHSETVLLEDQNIHHRLQ